MVCPAPAGAGRLPADALMFVPLHIITAGHKQPLPAAAIAPDHLLASYSPEHPSSFLRPSSFFSLVLFFYFPFHPSLHLLPFMSYFFTSYFAFLSLQDFITSFPFLFIFPCFLLIPPPCLSSVFPFFFLSCPQLPSFFIHFLTPSLLLQLLTILSFLPFSSRLVSSSFPCLHSLPSFLASFL